MRKLQARILRGAFVGFQVFAVVFAAVGVAMLVLLAVQGAFRKESLKEIVRVLRREPPPLPVDLQAQAVQLDAREEELNRRRLALEDQEAQINRVRDHQRLEEERIRRRESVLAAAEEDLRARQEAFRREVMETLGQAEQAYYRDQAVRTEQMRRADAAARLKDMNTRTVLEILRRISKEYWARLDPLLTQALRADLAALDEQIRAAGEADRPSLQDRRRVLQERLEAILYLREQELSPEAYAPPGP